MPIHFGGTFRRRHRGSPGALRKFMRSMHRVCESELIGIGGDLRFRSAFEPVRALPVLFFEPVAARRSIMPSSWSMPPQRSITAKGRVKLNNALSIRKPGGNSSMISRARVHACARKAVASARHRWTYRRGNGTKRKFFNDFSRARACACAQGKV